MTPEMLELLQEDPGEAPTDEEVLASLKEVQLWADEKRNDATLDGDDRYWQGSVASLEATINYFRSVIHMRVEGCPCGFVGTDGHRIEERCEKWER